MGRGLSGMDIILQVKDEWFKDLRRYLIPSLELMVAMLILVLPIMFILVPLGYLPLIMMYFIAEEQMYTLIPILAVFIILFYVLVIFYSIVINGIMMGGASAVSRRLMRGGDYRFFDIVKTGWRYRRRFIPVAGAIFITHMLIVNGLGFILFGAVSPFFLLVLIHPLFLIIPVLLLVLAYLALIIFNLFFMIFPYLTFTYHIHYKTRAWGSVRGALGFMMKKKGTVLLFGGFFYLVQLIGSMIPGLALFLTPAAMLFIHQCLHIALEEEKEVFTGNK